MNKKEEKKQMENADYKAKKKTSKDLSSTFFKYKMDEEDAEMKVLDILGSACHPRGESGTAGRRESGANASSKQSGIYEPGVCVGCRYDISKL